MVSARERVAVAYSGGTDALGWHVSRIHYDDGTVDERRTRPLPFTLVVIPRPGV